ncbi:helix-turn-helix domain-containing protein [Echinicola sp. 20G]|uniref:helix-turn-helix domain-containing protein n=1 Tax=Echinicola sp. 20G TaxID=2781961 RepID=UPI0019109EB3|nr:helix-turn-helix domain-containing protein [Echinicola sp. 20G]
MKIVLTTTEELNQLINEAVSSAVRKIPLQQTIPPNEKFLSRKEAAEKLRISLVTLNDYSKRGLVKSFLIGGRVLYKDKDLEACLHEVKPVKY